MLHVQSFAYGPFPENTYILFDDLKNCVIIDPGFYYPEEIQHFDQYLSSHHLQPTHLLNTHCHLDHVFGNKHVADKYSLQPSFHLKEQPVFDHAPASGLMYNLPFDQYVGEISYLSEGEELNIGESRLRLLLVPGHSPGHLCFYAEAEGFVIAGDTLFRRSIGRTDLPGGDHATLLNSIRSELFKLPPETIVYNGHGPATTIGEEMRENPFLI